MRLITSRSYAAGSNIELRSVLYAACGLILMVMMTIPVASAQEAPVFRFFTDRPALSTDVSDVIQRPAAAHYDVIALRVEFQPDESRFSTGDGTFEGNLYGGLQPSIDPLPHDAGYFRAHLSFLENYVRRSSSGRTTLTTHLLPGVVRLPNTMAAYSPTGPESSSDEELSKLARLVADAWTMADETIAFDAAGVDPARTAFLIFHAGVGRDIELIGTTLDKTPEDLPSLFFGAFALQRLIPERDIRFKGLDVDHTILSPRTETRRGTDFITDEPFLAEFSINGMLAATFFSYLGVPDLFDTQTGESGIGPFGLMDPLGIFAFNGLLPPEPSAWTKQFLGWADQEVAEGAREQRFALSASAADGTSAQVRVPISDGEYFLVENRHRKLDGDGVTLTVYRDGELVEKRFDNESSGFTRFDVSDFGGGVLVDASNFDWALPGGLDEDGNELNGGILIWHIDERRIAQGLSTNRVNADPSSRGVELKEADGAQDIGFPAGGDFGPQTHLGSPFDFYFEGNPVRAVTRSGREVVLYENRFGPDTTPSSDSHGGGPSFIVLEDFSSPGEVMSFSYRTASTSGLDRHGTLAGLALDVDASPVASLAFDGTRYVYVSESQRGRLIQVDIHSGDTEELHQAVGGRPAIGPDGQLVFAAIEDETVVLYVGDGRIPLRDAQPLSPIRVAYSDGTILVMDGAGGTYVIDEDARIATTGSGSGGGQFLPVQDSHVFIVDDRGARTVAYPSGQARGEWPTAPFDESCGAPVAGSDGEGELIAYACPEQNVIVLIDGQQVRPIDIEGRSELGDDLSSRLSLADVDGDGRLEVVSAAGSDIFAITRNGAMATGFPLRLPSDIRGEVLVVRRDQRTFLIASGSDGYLHGVAVGDPLRSLDGMPLPLGTSSFTTPLMREGLLMGLSESGVMQAWTFAAPPEVLWGEQNGDGSNARYQTIVTTPESDSDALLVESETYNWPNPIRDDGTYLRLMTTRRAGIDIKIIDAAGRMIDELMMDSVMPSAPAEVHWRSDVQSGLYFARITATDDEGRSESTVIKMAVIR